MDFTKMHGCGNDFVVCHDLKPKQLAKLIGAAPKLCDRRTGVGADGVVIIQPSHRGDFRMRIINADGSEAEMCGNGVRCAFVYVRAKGLTDRGELTFDTLAGPVTTRSAGNDVRVDMGAPVLEPEHIPVAQCDGPVLMKPLEVDGRTVEITAVSMGNPHAVVYADELTDELVLGLGPHMESHPFFPQRTNVEFVQVLGEREVRMRVYERGVGETMACGTGACAVVVAGVLNRKHGNAVTVHLNGGDLLVEWDGREDHAVHMTGPALAVFEGSLVLP